ncbi:MAG: hypothetical protein U5P41_11020 [Gammaproteobacteria bacterium]|nr:hypothetical protein [Gammaproteobacteria bacterium]
MSGRELKIKALFQKKTPIVIKLVIFAVGSIVLMTVDYRQNHLDNIGLALSVVVYPVQLMVDLPLNVASWSSEKPANSPGPDQGK